MATPITIAGAASALNQHVAKFSPQIHQKLKNEVELEKFFVFDPCNYSSAEVNVTTGTMLQPYQSAFTPNSSFAFDEVENILKEVKVDIEFKRDELDKFYSRWRTEWVEGGKPMLEWTYPRYIMEEVVLPQLAEDLNEASFKGVYAAPTPGTPGALLTSVTGIKQKIVDAITATSLTPIATGALSASTMVAKVEQFLDGLPEPYRGKAGVLMMAKTHAINYARDYRNKYGTAVGSDMNANWDLPALRVDGTNTTIMGFSGLEGSERFIWFPSQTRNGVVGTRIGTPVYPSFRFQEFDRTLKVLGEFYRFYGFRFWAHLFVNDRT